MTRLDVDAVTFDFWDTLVLADPKSTRALRTEAMLAVLGELGHGDLTATHVESAFDSVVVLFNESWAANRQFRGVDAAAHAIDRLGRPFAEHERRALIEAYESAGPRAEVRLAPNTAEVLRALDDAGLQIGIICDVGLTPSPVLRGYLARAGVLVHFDHWSFSDEVGVYKPHREIFEHALAGLGGVAPRRAVHVGDLRRTDVAGAAAFGMTAVRYRGANDDAPGDDDHPEARHVLDDHAELLALLGL